MARATAVELDFFAMENNQSNALLPRHRSFRDLQSAISKMNPEVLKSVISSSSGQEQIPANCVNPFAALPVHSPFPRPSMEKHPETAPLTIFYNGKVAVFDVAKDKADCILKLAEEGSAKAPKLTVASTDPPPQQQPPTPEFLDSLNDDLPIARKKSLQRFLEKRKERLTYGSPYNVAPCTPRTRF